MLTHSAIHGRRIEPINANHFLVYVQQDATLHSLFYLETALHVSGGTITHHQERKQLNLQHRSDRTTYKKAKSFSIKGSVPENVNYRTRILFEGGRINFSRWRR